SRPLARTLRRRLARHARDAAPDDADRRQGPPGLDAVAEPFLARAALRLGARADDLADPRPRPHLPDRLRLHRPRALDPHQRRALSPGAAAADAGGGVLRGD